MEDTYHWDLVGVTSIEACNLLQGAGTECWQKRRVHQSVISLYYALTPKLYLYEKTKLVFN